MILYHRFSFTLGLLVDRLLRFIGRLDGVVCFETAIMHLLISDVRSMN